MATRWGYNVFGRAAPSAFFLVGFLGGLGQLQDLLPTSGDASVAGVLSLLQELLSRFLGLCLIVLFAIRKRLVGRPSSLLGALVAFSATFYGTFIIFFDTLGIRPPAPNPDPAIAGLALVLALAGLVLLACSFVALGRHMGIFPEVRGLVTHGPYRYLRHPIYVAYLLGGLGGLVKTFSAEALLIFLTYYALITWRAALEERALEEVFGEQYQRYRQSTWGLGPPALRPR